MNKETVAFVYMMCMIILFIFSVILAFNTYETHIYSIRLKEFIERYNVSMGFSEVCNMWCQVK